MIPSKVYIIGVAGGSCSGKTTFVRKIVEEWNSTICSVLYQDSYYIDQSHRFNEDGGLVNFDHPSALDFDLLSEHLTKLRSGIAIDMPMYDFVTHKRKNEKQMIYPTPLILVDGTLILSQPKVRACLDYSFFLEVEEDVRFDRRKKRDTVERGRTLDGVTKQFLTQVKPMHDEFVEPSKKHAQSVVQSVEEGLAILRRLVSSERLLT